jgi:CheY-like chemotaxis protein
MAYPARDPADAPRLDGVHVLVVDDAPIVLEAVTEILRSVGATVTAVPSAGVALTALRSERPDVLLSDISMPGKDGYWLIDQVRALPAERGGVTPAIALTAEAGSEHRERALRARFQWSRHPGSRSAECSLLKAAPRLAAPPGPAAIASAILGLLWENIRDRRRTSQVHVP